MDCRRLTRRATIHEGVARWNACHPTVAFDHRIAEQRLFSPADGVATTAWGGFVDGDLAGFVATKRLREPVPGYPETDTGWVSLMVVDPLLADPVEDGTTLLETAVGDMRDDGITTIRFGVDIRKFLPGLPAAAEVYAPALESVGFERGRELWDLYCDIGSPDARAAMAPHLDAPDGVRARRARPEDEVALHAFMEREFDGRWAYQVETNCRLPGGLQDYWLVERDDEVVAFARTGCADSSVLTACVNWLDRWGARYCGLGPIGVAEDERGNGYGLHLIASAMDTFRETGYHHMTIDGVAAGLLDYYAQLEFSPELAFVGYATDQ
ncbi:GNAT family N-acetyltransferase [Haloarchaeobius sp. DFWS5]|uniref:GNAT family N-acetyltransferase n=1 Tax=Haloarchaeobius sp. DFWS5 TaxID=3446114 RepID=UPI003EBC9897